MSSRKRRADEGCEHGSGADGRSAWTPRRHRSPTPCSPSPPASAAGSETEDEERSEHHYMLRVGDTFDGGRYSVVAQLGKGTFGRVVQMRDSHRDALSLAVKVVRNVRKYRREAEIEAEILQVFLFSLFFRPPTHFSHMSRPTFSPSLTFSILVLKGGAGRMGKRGAHADRVPASDVPRPWTLLPRDGYDGQVRYICIYIYIC